MKPLNKIGESALHYAARNRDPHSRSTIMEALTAAGADAALQNAKGLTASDIAAGKDPQDPSTIAAAAAAAATEGTQPPAQGVGGAADGKAEVIEQVRR